MLFGLKDEELKSEIANNFQIEKTETVIYNPTFYNSARAWAVTFDYKFPRHDVFDCIHNRLGAFNFKDRVPCPNRVILRLKIWIGDNFKNKTIL